MAKPGRRIRYDIASPTMNYLPAMIEAGFLQKLDMSWIPNINLINPTFRKQWWTRPRSTRSPRTTGRPASSIGHPDPLGADLVEGLLRDVKGPRRQGDLRRLARRRVDLPAQDAGLLAQLRRRASSTPPARSCWRWRRTCTASTPTPMARPWPNGTAAMTLRWTGPLRQSSRTRPTGLRRALRGTAFWLDTWVMLADAPHPEASYAWLNFIQRPDRQGEETNYNLYATPNDAPRSTSSPRSWRPGDLPARGCDREPRGPAGHLQQHPAQRHLGRVQVEGRRLAAVAGRRSTMTVTAPPREGREPAVSGSGTACSRSGSCCRRRLVPRHAGPAAGDRRRVLVRHAGEERRLPPASSSTTTSARSTVGPVHRQPPDGVRRHDRLPPRRLPLAYFMAMRAGRNKSTLLLCSSSRSGRASSSGPTPR